MRGDADAEILLFLLLLPHRLDGKDTIRNTELDGIFLGLWLEGSHGHDIKESGFDGECQLIDYIMTHLGVAILIPPPIRLLPLFRIHGVFLWVDTHKLEGYGELCGRE